MYSRALPWRTKPSPSTAALLDTWGKRPRPRLLLLHRPGPLHFLLQDTTATTKQRKFRVRIGSEPTCSCQEIDVCVHRLFVLLQVLKVATTNPLVYQDAFTSRELDLLASGAAAAIQKTNATQRTRRAVRPRPTADATCPICQEAIQQQATVWCRFGCGAHVHTACMAVFVQHRIAEGYSTPGTMHSTQVHCPLCRAAWEPALSGRALLEMLQCRDRKRRLVGRRVRRTCSACRGMPSRGALLYRCVSCNDLTLCASCFTARGVKHVQRRRDKDAPHRFVVAPVGVCVYDVVGWRRVDPSRASSASSASRALQALQFREWDPSDYDLLTHVDDVGGGSTEDILASFLRVCACDEEVCSVRCVDATASWVQLPCAHAAHRACVVAALRVDTSVACRTCKKVIFPGLSNRSKPPVAEVGPKLPPPPTRLLDVSGKGLSGFGTRLVTQSVRAGVEHANGSMPPLDMRHTRPARLYIGRPVRAAPLRVGTLRKGRAAPLRPLQVGSFMR